jgi:hypothetical protein
VVFPLLNKNTKIIRKMLVLQSSDNPIKPTLLCDDNLLAVGKLFPTTDSLMTARTGLLLLYATLQSAFPERLLAAFE